MKNLIRLLFIISCFNVHAQNIGMANPISIRLSLDNPQGGVASQFIESVNFIPLETKKASIFGKIDRMEVTDEYFIIQDEDTNCLLFFTRTGKFHGKINGGNRITNPYNRILRWAINKFTKQIYFIKSKSDICYIYDFNSKKIAEQKISSSNSWTEIVFLGPNSYITNNGYSTKGDNGKSFISWVNNGIISPIITLPYTENDILDGDVLAGISGPFYNQGNGETLYSKSYDYTVYKIKDSSAVPYINFILPSSYFRAEDLLTNPSYKSHLIDYFTENKQKVYQISNVFQIENNLTFKTLNSSSDFKSDFLYNLKSGNLITFARIQPDQTSFYLPLTSDFEFSRRGILCSDENALYTSISAGDLSSAITENKKEKIGPNVTIPKELITLTRESNPVIRQVILKRSF